MSALADPSRDVFGLALAQLDDDAESIALVLRPYRLDRNGLRLLLELLNLALLCSDQDKLADRLLRFALRGVRAHVGRRRGTPLSRHNAARTIREAGEQAGLGEGVTPHVLRRTLGTALSETGVPVASAAVPGKETDVRRRGADWSFHLPDQHEIQVNSDDGWVSLSLPGEGTTYELGGTDETESEVIVRLGPEVASHKVGTGETEWPRGYPLPEIQDEIDRLRARWLKAGLPEQEFIAWPQGASHEDQLTRIRGRLPFFIA